MGIYDRDYMTDEETRARGAGLSAVVTLIIMNAAVWIAWRLALSEDSGSIAFQDAMATHFRVSADGVLREYHIHTLFTSAFSHVGLGHIFFNMYSLWLFGSEVETVYGKKNFFIAYLFCGLIGSLAFVGSAFLPMGSQGAALGASGAVMGMAVLAAIFNPGRQLLFMLFIPVSMRTLAILYIVLDLLGIFSGERTGIAHFAHLGGALGGYLFYKLDLRLFASTGRQDSGLLQRLKRFFRRKPKLRVVEPRDIPAGLSKDSLREPVATVHRAEAGADPRPLSRVGPAVDNSTAQRVDALLQKISREGMGALTPDERKFLEESSRKYRGE